MIGAGSLVGAIESGIEGVKPGWLSPPSSFGVLAYSFLIAMGLVLVAVESAKSGRPTWTGLSEDTPGVAARKTVLGRWRMSFRLVLLLALGPALLATALATARKATQYEAQVTTNRAGVQVVSSYVVARSDIPYDGEVRLGQRLTIAVVLIVTVLVHGAAAISVGLALTTANAWLRRAMVTAVGFTALGILALRALLAPLVSRTSFRVAETLRAAMFWNVIVILFAVGLSWCTIWVWKRRLSGLSKTKPSLATDFHDGPPTVEAGVAGD